MFNLAAFLSSLLELSDRLSVAKFYDSLNLVNIKSYGFALTLRAEGSASVL